MRPIRLVAIALLVLVTTACGPTREKPAPHVLLIGVDGADWTVIDALIGDGLLPNIARLKREGAHGVLTSIEPLFSPVVWASISTGKTPAHHGITSFTVRVGERAVPVTSNVLRASRVWEMLSAHARTVGVIGWWTTWPATPVDGFLCSDRLWPLRFGVTGTPVTSDSVPALPHRTYPEGLAAQLDPLIVERSELREADHARVDVTGPLGTVGRDGPSVADVLAKDLSFLRIARALYGQTRPAFFTVYYELPDVMSHYFWDSWRYSRLRRFGEPTVFAAPPKQMTPEAAEYVGRNFERGYELVDDAIGELLAEAPESTLVLVVSDHGYGENAAHERLHVGDDLYAVNTHWHRPEGVLLAWGYGVQKGHRVAQASVLDVTPTILYALGEPVGRDMDGTVLRELFTPAFAARAVEEVDSYEVAGRDISSAPISSHMDESYREMLRSLGYIR